MIKRKRTQNYFRSGAGTGGLWNGLLPVFSAADLRTAMPGVWRRKPKLFLRILFCRNRANQAMSGRKKQRRILMRHPRDTARSAGPCWSGKSIDQADGNLSWLLPRENSAVTGAARSFGLNTIQGIGAVLSAAS